jgi:3-hydroxyisobutyrate dehydrogenase
LAPLGAITKASASDLAGLCSIILLCLPDSRAVETVVLGPEGILSGGQPESVIIDMTTAYPISTRHVSEQLHAKELEMLDAPVSGGAIGAEAGTLAVMVGGKKEVFERCRPILTVIAPKNLTYVGPLGWGHAIKGINNFLNAVQRWVSTEAVILAVKAGVSPDKAVEVLRAGSARNYSLDVTFPNFILPERPQAFAAELLRKDVEIVTEMGKALGIPMPMANHLRDLFEFFLWLEGPKQEVNQYVRHMERWAGVNIRR